MAIALPIPFEAPVIRAVFPDNNPMSIIRLSGKNSKIGIKFQK